MRILILSINYWPDETGIAAFNIWRCEYLASRGHQVTICTGPPYYPEWRVPEPYRGRPWQRRAWQREEHNGVTILRSWMYVPRALTTKKRILHEASFLAGSFARAWFAPMPGGTGVPGKSAAGLQRRTPDLILAVSPPLGLALTASALARLWRVPFVFDVEDLQPDAAVELGMMKNGALVRALYRIERMAYERAALVSTITEGMRQRIVGKGIDPAKVVLFPPRADSSLYTLRQRCDGAAFRERYGLQGKLIVSHSGNMGVKQGLEVILEAAERSRQRSDIHYIFVGDGAMRHELQLHARARSLHNVLFLPLLDAAEFHQMLAATDIALITQQRVVSNIVFPSKTVTLLCAGCPVIASVNAESEVARAVVRSQAGEVVAPEDAGALYEAIDRLSRSPETLARMSTQARQFAEENWDERRTLPQIEEQLMRCVERTRR
jgi:putative colanic acid biosynthesis glycosyltransferase WcaI